MCKTSHCLRSLAATLLFLFSANAATTEIQFGHFVISVSDSWTAQVFHMVDMLAQWDESSHQAYRRWAARNLLLDAEDRQLLQKHAEMRRTRGWGNGFEQAFLSEDTFEIAAAKALKRGLLTASEAESERTILLHFAPKLRKLRCQQQKELDAFLSRLQAENRRLSSLFQKLLVFTQTQDSVTVPVFLVANPERGSGGGEANGGRIIVEVPAPDPMGALFHESLHILLARYSSEIKVAAESVGLSPLNLNEGITYALAPGLTDNASEVDSLAEGLARYVVRGTAATNNYVQSYMIANILRPVLRGSIERGETFTQFLPKAVAKWRSFKP